MGIGSMSIEVWSNNQKFGLAELPLLLLFGKRRSPNEMD
jgi:hypothetical protein